MDFGSKGINMHLGVSIALFAALTLVAGNHHADQRDTNTASEKDLRRHLFEGQGYDKLVRPVKNPKNGIPSQVLIEPIFLRDVDFMQRTLTLETWFTLLWEDEYLKWDPKDFGGLDRLTLPLSEIWSPEIAVFSAVADSHFLPDSKLTAVIRHTGEVARVAPFSIRNRCPAMRAGSDRLECAISVLSLTYDITQLPLDLHKAANQSSEFFEDTHPDWHLASMSTSREIQLFPCCPDPFPILHFRFTFERKNPEAPRDTLRTECQASPVGVP